MTADKLADAILKKCDIYYGESLISKEAIIEKYLSFFADSLVSNERTVNIALHTGSICFDIISVVAVALGCLSYNVATNDEIIMGLQSGDMVMYKGQRFRWKGIKLVDDKDCMVLEQDGKGKNGKTTSYLPFEKNKHLIRPYYGESQVTDGRGVRHAKTNREDFLSYIFDIDIAEVPTQVDVSIVIIADRFLFNEFCKQIWISYDGGKKVGLLDIVPASYYTATGEEHQFGSNPTKAEPVLKVTSKVSEARDLVLDRHSNKVVGLLVTGDAPVSNNRSELADLLRRKALRFSHVAIPMKAGLGEYVLEQYEGASLFACTKEFLLNNEKPVCASNSFTNELHRQIANVIHSEVTPIDVIGGWKWGDYRELQNELYALKQSNWSDSAKEDFIITAHGLINLFRTAIFSMSEMETAIEDGAINRTVLSPKQRISSLLDITETAGGMQDICFSIADSLDGMYKQIAKGSEKLNVLIDYIHSRCGQTVAVIVPKAYYAEVLSKYHPELFEICNLVCVTANRFDAKQNYDSILVVGELNSKKFDPLQCMAARSIDVLLYECEKKTFTFRKRKQNQTEKQLNSRIGIQSGDPDVNGREEITETDINEDIERFSSLDEYIDSLNTFDIRAFAQSGGFSGISAMTAEVKYIGAFSSGEQIFFSKYYSAVTYDSVSETVVEKSPEELVPGDVLVFVKRNDYTRNIVDYIYEKLLREGRLSSGAIEAFEKSQYWKEVLREYKNNNGLTYRMLAKNLSAVGSTVQEVTVRQWMIEDSHIVGPRKEDTLTQIAKLTQDPYLLSDTHGNFEACRAVRHDRREILNLIAKAINDKLSGNLPSPGSVLEVVYANVENLSETLELEYITELEATVNVNINIVNTPVTEAEVSM